MHRIEVEIINTKYFIVFNIQNLDGCILNSTLPTSYDILLS